MSTSKDEFEQSGLYKKKRYLIIHYRSFIFTV